MKSKLIFILSILFLFSLVGANSYQNYYDLELNYDTGILNLSSVEISFSDYLKNPSFGFWVAEVVNYPDEILNLTFFNIPNQIFWESIDNETGEINEGGIIYLDNFTFNLEIPYYKNAKEINIYNEEFEKVLTIDVSMYSKEKPVIQEILQIETQNKSFTKPQEKSFEEKIAENWWIFILVLVILLLILFFRTKKKK